MNEATARGHRAVGGLRVARPTNARVAGVTFLVYIAAGITSLALSGRPQATAVLSVVTSFSALVLGVTLYAITRTQDPDLAMLALTCRVIEAIPGAAGATLFLGGRSRLARASSS